MIIINVTVTSTILFSYNYDIFIVPASSALILLFSTFASKEPVYDEITDRNMWQMEPNSAYAVNRVIKLQTNAAYDIITR